MTFPKQQTTKYIKNFSSKKVETEYESTLTVQFHVKQFKVFVKLVLCRSFELLIKKILLKVNRHIFLLSFSLTIRSLAITP
jgi:hypothetical protein